MSRIVIGTAGHIDHGKTTLVKALTGVDTDRLKEEKARGITIELGFATLVLPGGSQAAIIDVPGHERFIKNMLAGAAGIDLALLIVAANEGVMPQTREHLDILCLLEIRKLIVVITKIDLVEEEFLALIREDIQELLRDTRYDKAPTAEVSVYNGQGLENLLKLLEEAVLTLPGREIKEGLCRLPMDRVFTVQGIGTVVTGTLFDGVIKSGDILEVPGKIPQVKVRSLQVHGKSVQEALAGQRVAANLAGVELGKIKRGDVLISPRWLSTSNRIDLSLKLLKDSPEELVDMVRVRFHQGTKESLGRVFVLGKERIIPGEEGFIQLVLEEPVVVAREDTYILRSYSPLHTIGGGRVIEPTAIKHKKKQQNLVEELVIKSRGEIPQLATFILDQSRGIVRLDDLAKNVGLSPRETQLFLSPLVDKGFVIELRGSEGEPGYLSSANLQRWEALIAREINAHCQQFPLSPGLNKEIVRTKMSANISVRDYNILLQLMEDHQVLKVADNQYLLPYGFVQRIPAQLAKRIEAIKSVYNEAAWQVPDWKTVVERVSLNDGEAKQLITFMLREGTLINLGEDIYLPASLLPNVRRSLQAWFDTNSTLTVAQFRDLLGTTRRVAVPLLEYLDRAKATKRQDDKRVPGPALFDSTGKGLV